MFKKNELLGKIKQNGLTLGELAQFLGINLTTLSRKMNGTSDFTRNEILMMRGRLNLSVDELEYIFFS